MKNLISPDISLQNNTREVKKLTSTALPPGAVDATKTPRQGFLLVVFFFFLMGLSPEGIEPRAFLTSWSGEVTDHMGNSALDMTALPPWPAYGS
jgi:hypothetical protein